MLLLLHVWFMLLCIYSMDCWLLSLAFMYVAMDFLVLIVFHFMDTLVLTVTYRDFLMLFGLSTTRL